MESLVLLCLTGIGGFLGSYLGGYLKEKGKNLATKEDVHDITHKVESIKTTLKSQLHISQVRYEKEFEILSELAEKLVELRDSAVGLQPTPDLVDQNEPAEQRRMKRLNRYTEAVQALYQVSEKKRPFYPEEIYDLIQKFGLAAFREAIRYKVQGTSTDLKDWDKATQNAEKILGLANETILAIRQRIKYWEKIDADTFRESN